MLYIPCNQMCIFITLRKDYIIKYNVLGIRKHNTTFISRHDKLLFQIQFLLRSCLRHHRAVPACANP